MHLKGVSMDSYNEDFNLFNESDRRDVSYKLCVGGSVGLGIMVGSWAPVVGSLVGAASGLAVGMMTCKKLSPAIEKKLFTYESFTEKELTQVIKVVKEQTGVKNKSDAMYLLSHARVAAITKGDGLNKTGSTLIAPRAAATSLLEKRV